MIDALGSELVGSTRPLVITSVVAMGIASPGRMATEDHFDRSQPNPLRTSEKAGAAVADRGVNVSVIRLPQVMTSSSRVSLAVLSRSQGTKEFLRTSVWETIAGRRDMSLMLRTYTGLHGRSTKRVVVIMRLGRRAYSCDRSRK